MHHFLQFGWVCPRPTHLAHHLACHLHHLGIVHHFLNHWVVDHVRHIWRHSIHVGRHTCWWCKLLLRSYHWALPIGGIWWLHLSSSRHLLFEHVWVVFCHIGSHFDGFWRQISHHLVELCVRHLPLMHSFILSPKHARVGTHHVDHVINLTVVHPSNPL